jgi:hypothetical membrane protein
LRDKTIRKLLPWLLIGVPVLYYFALLVAAATYPGYSHVTNYASELGAAEAPYPQMFNIPIFLAGVVALIAATLLPAVLAALGGKRLWATLAAITLSMWGASMIMGGWFPMPDERHGAFGLGLVGPLIPLFVLISIRQVPDAAGMRIFLGVVFVASVAMLAIMLGVGSLVTRSNVGVYQRLNTAVSIPWFAVLGIWILLRQRPRARA